MNAVSEGDFNIPFLGFFIIFLITIELDLSCLVPSFPTFLSLLYGVLNEFSFLAEL